jgi:hypothetical protein
MRYPQLLIYESDGRIAEMFRRVRGEDKRHKFAMREPRALEACLRLLRHGGPSMLILKMGQDLVRELTLLERVTWTCPEAAVVVVGDSENTPLVELIWDLGATYVLFPPLPREWLKDIVDGYLLRPAPDAKAPPAAEPQSELLILPESES